MKKLHILFCLLVSTALMSCGIQDKLAKHERAQAQADYIIENLNKKEVASKFPAKAFPVEQTDRMIEVFSSRCNWNARQGRFIDFTTISNNGQNSVAFIYEYLLDCDSIRLVLTYNIDTPEPALTGFQIEPIERKNPLVVHPEKQLLR